MTARKPRKNTIEARWAWQSFEKSAEKEGGHQVSLYRIHQNNSGGSFRKPAVNIVVRAKSEDEALALASKHITFCSNNGTYAAYDECGCCPCCGHRWYPSAYEETTEEIAMLVGRFALWGYIPMLAVIDTDGTMRVGTTEKEDAALRKELSEKNK